MTKQEVLSAIWRSQFISYGWSITTKPHRVSGDLPTTIHVHKLGSSDSMWFTPDELRGFAAKLIAAANKADEESR